MMYLVTGNWYDDNDKINKVACVVSAKNLSDLGASLDAFYGEDDLDNIHIERVSEDASVPLVEVPINSVEEIRKLVV